MKFQYLDITVGQIRAGVEVYENWLAENDADAMANMVCGVFTAMYRDNCSEEPERSCGYLRHQTHRPMCLKGSLSAANL